MTELKGDEQPCDLMEPDLRPRPFVLGECLRVEKKQFYCFTSCAGGEAGSHVGCHRKPKQEHESMMHQITDHKFLIWPGR